MNAPYNHKAERAVLGAVLRSVDAYYSVSELLRADHFYLPQHQQIFSVVRDICEANQRLAPSLICARLPPVTDGVAVESTIGILLKEAEDIEVPLDFVEIIKVDWKARKLKEFAQFTVKLADNSSKMADEKIFDIQKHLEAIEDQSSEVSTTTFGQAAQIAVEETAKNYQTGGKSGIGIITGIAELDALVGLMMPGDSISVLAQSGHAKTALLTQILRATAEPSLDASSGQPSLFVSMEMKAHQIARRVLAADIGVETKKQRMGDITPGDFENLVTAAKYLNSLPIIFDDRGPMTIEEIVASMRKAKRLHKIKVAGIDHNKIIKPSRANWTIVQTIENAQPMLKSIAKELDIVVIQLCQMTREGGKRDNWRPKEQDAYGGGAIKENADIMIGSVLPLEWLKQNEPPDDNQKDHDKWVQDCNRWKDKAEFGALKIRDGQNGNWKTVPFNGPRMLFGERAISAVTGPTYTDDDFR